MLDHASIDVFVVAETTTLICKGKGTLHVTGYFEPGDDEDSADEGGASALTTGANPVVAVTKSPVGEARKSPKIQPESEESSEEEAAPTKAKAGASGSGLAIRRILREWSVVNALPDAAPGLGKALARSDGKALGEFFNEILRHGSSLE